LRNTALDYFSFADEGLIEKYGAGFPELKKVRDICEEPERN